MRVFVLLALAACTAQDLDGDGQPAGPMDCNDADAFVHVGAAELCDGRDNDCNLRIDEIFDLDRDGFLDRSDPNCEATFGAATDCDDQDSAVHPGAAETCDGRDEDCTGRPDDAWDQDGDGSSPCGDDCDDHEPAAHPGATETCDGIDNDCDATVDEDFDQDGDGFAPCRGDCDDADPATNPFTVELCDGIDQNCDGLADDGFDADADGASTCVAPFDCDDTNPARLPGADEICDGWDNDCDDVLPLDESDADWDGARPCQGDCDDLDPARGPGFPELCDGQDNDCDLATLEDADLDADGETPCTGDCDDADPTRSPSLTEVCNGWDDDCDVLVDEGDPLCLGCTPLGRLGTGYWFCPVWQSFEGSRGYCESFGGTMAVPDDLEENDWMWAQASQIAWDWWWLGLDDLVEEGVWRTPDGSPAPFLNWAPDQPDNSAEEDCAHLFGKTRWNDVACAAGIPFICEAGPGT